MLSKRCLLNPKKKNTKTATKLKKYNVNFDDIANDFILLNICCIFEDIFSLTPSKKETD